MLLSSSPAAPYALSDLDPARARFAVFAVPDQDSDWHRFGCSWLRRDIYTGEVLDPPPLPEDTLSAAEHEALTAAPRRYGFHATLKPPFTLAPHQGPQDLAAALYALERHWLPVRVPALSAQALGPILALRPSVLVPEVNSLAAACVQTLDPFRAPSSAAEIQRRLAGGLTPTQRTMLQRWGYPYVLSEFRFHLTLTAPLRDPLQWQACRLAVAPLLEPLSAQNLTIERLTLVAQPDQDSDFRVVTRPR